MKRAHRRMHLLIWLLIAPTIAVAGVLFWKMRPTTPYSELPAGIEAISEAPAEPSETP